jgi:uncharacterized membrane protein YagU involved in acid resistance
MSDITLRHAMPAAIVYAGLVSGTVDIGAACLIYRIGPADVLRAIASGLVGKAAFQDGVAIVLLGLLLQWSMSILIAAIYTAATAPFPGLRVRWLLTGVAAGVVIFLVMNYIVVPLSAMPLRPHFDVHSLLAQFTPYKLIANLIAMIIFGLIIAFFSRRQVPSS